MTRRSPRSVVGPDWLPRVGIGYRLLQDDYMRERSQNEGEQTFGDSNDISKRDAGIHLHLFQGIIITLRHASMSAPRRSKKLAHNDIQCLDTLNEK